MRCVYTRTCIHIHIYIYIHHKYIHIIHLYIFETGVLRITATSVCGVCICVYVYLHTFKCIHTQHTWTHPYKPSNQHSPYTPPLSLYLLRNISLLSVFRCVAVCCSVLQSAYNTDWRSGKLHSKRRLIKSVQTTIYKHLSFEGVAGYCSALQSAYNTDLTTWEMALWDTTYRVCTHLQVSLFWQIPPFGVCCSVLQCVAVCCSVHTTQTDAVGDVPLQHTATHCNTLQHTQKRDVCSTYVPLCPHVLTHISLLSVLQCVAMCCSVMQRVYPRLDLRCASVL